MANTERNSNQPLSTVGLREITERSYTPMKLRPKWLNFVGHVPNDRQFRIQLVGDRGSGKSTYALELANEFARHGTVLYVCAEERPDAGTIKIRAKYLGITNANIHLLDTAHVDDMRRVLASGHRNGRYRFCFVDSISVMKEGDLATLAVSEEMSDVTFVYINQVNSEGEARGSRVVGHACDIVTGFRIEKDGTRMAYNAKNRYGAIDAEMVVFKPVLRKSGKSPQEQKADPGITWDVMEQARIHASYPRLPRPRKTS